MEINREQLVSMIVKEVMERVIKDGNNKNSDKAAVMVLGTLDKLPKAISEKYDCKDMDDFTVNKDIDAYTAVYVTEITSAQLCDVALARDDSGYTSIILNALLRGKPVYLYENALGYKKYRKTASCKLLSVLDKYTERLIDYGITMLGADEAQDISCIKGAAKAENPKIYKDKLITATVAEAIVKAGDKKLAFSSDTIITPSAMDVLRAAGLEFTKLH